MTQEQVAVVQQSFAKVAPIADRAAVMFYERLFEVAPQVKAMFPADMAEQRQKLMATLGVVVNGLSNGSACRKRARQTSCRLRRKARALPRRRLRAVVDTGEGAR